MRSILTAITVAVLASAAQADIDWELGFDGGYTNNLLSEAVGYDDSHSTTRASLKHYPLAGVRLNLDGEYTYYGNLYRLSNWVGRTGLAWIPTAADSPTSFYVEGSFDIRRYRGDYEEFDNNNGLLKAALGHTFNETLRIRTGAKFNATSYINSDTTTDADYEQYELFAGLNATLFGTTSFDLETGVGLTRYSYIDATVDSVIPPIMPGLPGQAPPNQFLQDGNFEAFYVSPRISHPLGDRTGISLTYTYRQFFNIDDAVVLGYTTDFLSPWASFFDGSAIQLRVKSLLVPHMIVNAGFGYWDKTYLRTIEQSLVEVELYPGYSIEELRWLDPKDAGSREDEMLRLYIGFQRPFAIGGGAIVEPRLSLDYTHNSSSLDSYDYSSTAVAAGITYRP